MLNKTFVVISPQGFHARPASLLAAEAGKFKSDIKVKYKNREVTAKSILSILALGIENGASIELTVNGEDQEQAMKRMDKLFKEEIQHL